MVLRYSDCYLPEFAVSGSKSFNVDVAAGASGIFLNRIIMGER